MTTSNFFKIHFDVKHFSYTFKSLLRQNVKKNMFSNVFYSLNQ